MGLDGLPLDVQVWLNQAMRQGILCSVKEMTSRIPHPHDIRGIEVSGLVQKRSFWEHLLRVKKPEARMKVEAVVYVGRPEGYWCFGDVIALVTRHNGRMWELGFSPELHQGIKETFSMHYLNMVVH